MSVKKIIKTGNSLAVTIPANFSKLLGLTPGQAVKVEIKPEKGEMSCFFTGNKQLSLKVFGKKQR